MSMTKSKPPHTPEEAQSSLVSSAASMGRVSRFREEDDTDLEAQTPFQDRMKSIDLKDLGDTAEIVPAGGERKKKNKKRKGKRSCCDIFCKVVLVLLVILGLAMIGAGIWFLWFKVHHANAGRHRPETTTSVAVMDTAPSSIQPNLDGPKPNNTFLNKTPISELDSWSPTLPPTASQLSAPASNNPHIQTRDSDVVTVYGTQNRTLSQIIYDLEVEFNPLKIWNFAMDTPCNTWEWLESHGWLKCPWGGKWLGDPTPDGGFADQHPGYFDCDKVNGTVGGGYGFLFEG